MASRKVSLRTGPLVPVKKTARKDTDNPPQSRHNGRHATSLSAWSLTGRGPSASSQSLYCAVVARITWPAPLIKGGFCPWLPNVLLAITNDASLPGVPRCSADGGLAPARSVTIFLPTIWKCLLQLDFYLFGPWYYSCTYSINYMLPYDDMYCMI